MLLFASVHGQMFAAQKAIYKPNLGNSADKSLRLSLGFAKILRTP